MAIVVVDQSAELYWFVSNALLQDELALKHLNNVSTGENYILQELPKIVVLSGDDSSIDAVKFITKIRNHVFARGTLFIVVTSDTSPEYKKSLIIAGAGQVFYRGRGHNPSPKFFRNIIKWFLNLKSPDPQLIEYKPVQFETLGEFSTFGRIGWMSTTQCYIEVNLDLSPGQTIEMHCPLFDELDIKDSTLTIVEKNKTGRYYQYSNGYLCKIQAKNNEREQKKLKAWIDSNQDISKYKPIKVLYFEQDANNREVIKSMIKVDQRYCARGFSHFDNLIDDLNYQLPHLVLVDRQLIKANPTKFDPIKKFLQGHFCYCVTYDNEGTTNPEDFKKNYDFAMHVPSKLDSFVLESMVKKLEMKLSTIQKDDQKGKVFFNKYSAYSRLSLHAECRITELATSGIGVALPFPMSSYCAFEITSQGFTHMSLNRMQYFRSFINKKLTNSVYHQCVFIGQTIADNEIIKKVVEDIKLAGFEEWKTKN